MKKTTHYKGHRWTDDQLKALMSMWAADEELDVISEKLQATQDSIRKMIVRLRQNGIPLKRRRRGNRPGKAGQSWTQGDVEYLIRRRAEKATSEEIALELQRSVCAVSGMIERLRAENVPIAMRGMGVRRLWNADSLKAVAIQHPEQSIILLNAKSV